MSVHAAQGWRNGCKCLTAKAKCKKKIFTARQTKTQFRTKERVHPSDWHIEEITLYFTSAR